MEVRAKVLGLAAAMMMTVWQIGSVNAAAPTAAESLTKLKAGNAKFVANPQEPLPIDAARRTALTKGQTPFAAILSCSDSRVPPEVIFHAGLGDLLVIRAAGNITDKAILASAEYAAERLNVPLIVVMGHESCAEVKTAVDTPIGASLGPNLDYLLKAIRPSVVATSSKPEAERMKAAILENVEETLNDMIAASSILRELGAKGHVAFVGAYYELGTGKVYFSEPVTPAPVKEPHTTGGHQQ